MPGLIHSAARLHVIYTNHDLPHSDIGSFTYQQFLDAPGKLTRNGKVIAFDATVDLDQSLR